MPSSDISSPTDRLYKWAKNVPKTVKPALSVDPSFKFNAQQDCYTSMHPVIGPVLDPTPLRFAHQSTMMSALLLRMKSSFDNHVRDRTLQDLPFTDTTSTLTPTTQQRLSCYLTLRGLDLWNAFRKPLVIIIIIMQIYKALTRKFLAYNSWIWGAFNSGYKCQPNAQSK